MSGLTGEELAAAATLNELYPQLAKIGLGAGWNKPTPSLWPEPHKTDQAKGALGAAGRLINTELAERRNLILVSPLAGNRYATVTRPMRCGSYSTRGAESIRSSMA